MVPEAAIFEEEVCAAKRLLPDSEQTAEKRDEFYRKILANELQLAEWKKLYGVAYGPKRTWIFSLI